GSFLVPLTVAVFVRVAGVAGAREVMVTVALAARASVPSLQVTVLVPEHLPWLVVADRKVAWAGSLSTSWAPLVEDGPLLAMDSVYVSVSFTRTGGGFAVVVTPRSAPTPRQLGKVNDPILVCQSN